MGSRAELYYQLSQRQKYMMENIEDHIDVMAKFSKDESHAYLKHRQEVGGEYDTKVIKYARETHMKHAQRQAKIKNAQYLMYAEKVVSSIAHQ